MKLSTADLHVLIRECYRELLESVLIESGGTHANFGGLAGALGAVREPEEPPLENQADSIVQDKALHFFMELGLEDKVAKVMVGNIAIPDLIAVMTKVPKIDTAAEGDEDLYESYSLSAQAEEDT